MDGDVDFDPNAFYNLIGSGLRLQTARRDYRASGVIPCRFVVESRAARDALRSSA